MSQHLKLEKIEKIACHIILKVSHPDTTAAWFLFLFLFLFNSIFIQAHPNYQS